MVNIEQVKLLEQRVQKVIARMAELRTENTELRERLGSYQDKITELEERIVGFSSNQEAIEQGILNALHQLDEVEDAVAGDLGESRIVDAERTAEEEQLPAESAAQDQPSEPDQHEDNPDAAGDQQSTTRQAEVEEDKEEASGGSPELDIF